MRAQIPSRSEKRAVNACGCVLCCRVRVTTKERSHERCHPKPPSQLSAHSARSRTANLKLSTTMKTMWRWPLISVAQTPELTNALPSEQEPTKSKMCSTLFVRLTARMLLSWRLPHALTASITALASSLSLLYSLLSSCSTV